MREGIQVTDLRNPMKPKRINVRQPHIGAYNKTFG